jgi:hypothetical protein
MPAPRSIGAKRKCERPNSRLLFTVVSATGAAAAMHWAAITFGVGGPAVLKGIAAVAFLMAVCLATRAAIKGNA